MSTNLSAVRQAFYRDLSPRNEFYKRGLREGIIMAEEKPEKKEEKTTKVEAQATAPEKKSKKGLLVGCLVGCGVLLIIGVIVAAVLFGVIGSKANLKAYVNQSTEMYNTSQKWAELTNVTTLSEAKTNFGKIATSSDKYLNDLEKAKAPKEATKLESDLKEYFTLTKKVSTGFVAIYDWLEEIQNITKQFESAKAVDSSSPASFASSLRDFKTNLDKSIIKLDSMQVPQEVAKSHSSLKVALRNFSASLDKLITAADTKNRALIDSAEADMTSSLTNMGSTFSAETFDTLYKTESDRATQLEKDIQAELTKLSK